MKYKIRNKKTMSFASKLLNITEASKLCRKMGETFEVVPIEEPGDEKNPFVETKEDKYRVITKIERSAIKALANITPSGNTNHADFINGMLFILGKNPGDVELSGKQIGYIWGLIWHYRRQITDGRLVVLANHNKLF